MTTKRELLAELPYGFLRGFALQTRVVRPRAYSDKKEYVKGLARQLTKPECEFLFEYAMQGRAVTIASEAFTRQHRPNDELVREELRADLSARHGSGLLLEEVSVGENRADLVFVDDRTMAYEIKSPRDSYDRLPAQLDSYSQVFDEVYVVIPEGDPLPGCVGDRIGVSRYDYPEFEFEIEREAASLTQYPEAQLKTLWLQELDEFASNLNTAGLTTDEKERELIEAVRASHSDDEIAALFNHCLRHRGDMDSVTVSQQQELSV